MTALALKSHAVVMPIGLSVDKFRCELVALIPHLRSYSRRLCGRRALADDIVQEALAKALRSQERFEFGTNLKAWTFTILRNEYYSLMRRNWRETHLDPAVAESIPCPANGQEWAIAISDAARALHMLTDNQRKAVLLAAAGNSYDEISRISGAPIGTVKSRVARARAALTDLLDSGKPLPQRTAMRATDEIESQLSELIPLMSAKRPFCRPVRSGSAFMNIEALPPPPHARRVANGLRNIDRQ